MSADQIAQKGFLDVFVIRSFRESHLDKVMQKIKAVVESYPSAYWGGVSQAVPFRIVDTNEELTSGCWVRDEVCKKIANAAICIVILDGMRSNIFFELGFLQALRRPYVLLKHRRYGPSFGEIDLDVSDLKGQVVKEYDHEEDGGTFEDLLRAEITRCDGVFIHGLGTHVVVPRGLGTDNLINMQDKGRWDSREPKGNAICEWTERGLEIKSGAYEYQFNRHVSQSSLFIVGAELRDSRSTLTAYLEAHFRKADNEVPVWFGYSSHTVAPYGDHRGSSLPVEITIPLAVSGSSRFEFVDNIWKMVSNRLSTEHIEPLRVSRVCLWARNGGALVSEVRVTD